jgi:signal transduction histidine kinase
VRRLSISAHLAIATIVVAGVALIIVGVGVQRVGENEFERLMVLHGASVSSARDMFANSVSVVLLAALAAALGTTLFLATGLARWMSGPVLRVSDAAARLVAGDYRIRLKPGGPRELASLVESFNQLASELERQDQVRQAFIENAAHELRTPLTNLHGYLEGLRDSVIAPNREVFSSLDEEVERLVRLTDSLEVMARGTARADQPCATDLLSALDVAVRAASPQFAQRGIIVSRKTPPKAEVHVDPDNLAQILANLLQNATRYTNDGGEVDIQVEPNRGSILVEIANTGAGIPAPDLPRIFERFYRVDKSRNRTSGGAGVGLAIVKQLVVAAGGDVGADSDSGWTRFWFCLPSAASS